MNHENEIILKGINSSPGICIGMAYIVENEGVDLIEKYYIKKEDLHDEITRFKISVKKAKKEIKKIIKSSPAELHDHRYILESNLALFKDKLMYDKIIETIEKEHVNAEWATKKNISKIIAMFQDMPDSYLRDRVSDVDYVAKSILKQLAGAENTNISDIDKKVILVADDLSPAETSHMRLDKIMGFITNRGGRASHTSIIARSLEIPAVTGLDDVTSLIQNEDVIVLDGNSGTVIVNPSEDTVLEYHDHKTRYGEYKAVIAGSSHLPGETTDGLRFKVMGNIEFPRELKSVVNYGGEGVGLYRTEFQYLNRSNFPSEEELFKNYKEVAQSISPHPVTIRTLDINGDKIRLSSMGSIEPNPALGLRAIRYCLKNSDVFIAQIRAILRAAAFGNVRILLPMISSYEEIVQAKQMMDEAAESLNREGLEFNRNIETGIMIEVPSAVVMADKFADQVDFFSIGTNDLVQYTLAIDRGNKQVSYLYNPLHPALIHMLKHVADIAVKHNIKVSICGEMAGEPLNIPVIVGLGIEELSMNPQSIPIVKKIIRSINAADAKKLISVLLEETESKGVVEVIKNSFGSIINSD